MEEQPSAGQGKGVRHAEKSRRATCAFADRVATLCVEAYRRAAAELPFLERGDSKTVFAAFLVGRSSARLFQDACPSSSPNATCTADVQQLEVVACGLGTKFVDGDKSGDRLRDLHAEALARRAFKVYLHRQLETTAESQAREGGGEKGDAAENAPIVAQDSDGFFSLRSGCSVHFYTSSAPCGNATVRRWATAGTGTAFPSLSPSQQPLQSHPLHLFPHSAIGQVALLAKASRGAGVEREDWLPSSCARLGPSRPLPILSCSDKVANLNALGVPVSRFLSRFAKPVYIRSVTVGRKFSLRHSERALCCRLQPPRKRAAFLSLPPPFSINHPALMTCSVKFDDGVFLAEAGAIFSEYRCLAWLPQCPAIPYQILDGLSGVLIMDPSCPPVTDPSHPSLLSSSSLHALFGPKDSRYQQAFQKLCIYEPFNELQQQQLSISSASSFSSSSTTTTTE